MINGEQVELSEEAEHVGIVRSPQGNLPILLNSNKCYSYFWACQRAQVQPSCLLSCAQTLWYSCPDVWIGKFDS